jgi:hypothetical protein
MWERHLAAMFEHFETACDELPSACSGPDLMSKAAESNKEPQNIEVKEGFLMR